MSTDWRAELQALLSAYDAHGGRWPQHHEDAPMAAVEHARAVLARYGHQPAPSAVGEGVTDDEIERRFQVWWYDEGSGMPPGADEDSEAHVHRVSQIAWRNGAYVARYGHQPAPPAEGEVAELAVFLRGCADDHHGHGRRQFTRAADLLEQRQAAPVPVAEPVAEGPTPSDEELLKLARAELNNSPNWEEPEYDASNPFPYEAPGIAWLNFARAVLARFGHQPAPVPVAEFDCPACEDVPIDTIRAALKRLQELENNADLSPAPAPAEGEVAGPTRDDLWELWLRLNNELPDRPAAVAEFWEHAQIDARARWGRPAPAPAGKAAEVMGLFRRWADAYPDGVMVDPYWLTRAADLLEQFSSGWVVPTVEQFAPVPVAERLPDASDPRECRMPDGSCWWFDPHEDGAWYFDAYQGNYTHWLPAHALPLPAGEVE